MKNRILLVEDEETLLNTIKLNLELEGYEVITAVTGNKAISEFKRQRIDLIVLDVMLPEMDGFAVCEAIRMEGSTVPILFLTAKNSGNDRVYGLKIGADDYLTKPFNLEEFLLRVQVLLKRSSRLTENLTNEYNIGNSKVNFLTYEITDVKNNKHTLTRREIMLLKLLIERKNEVVSRDQILEKVWGYDVYPSTRSIDNYILAFRKYFETDPKNPRHFYSIRGVGYKFSDGKQ